MEPLSAAVTVLEVAGAITSVIAAATAFMRDVRSARQEIIAVRKELTSLRAVLEILADDFHDAGRINFPDSVLERIVDVAADCQNVVGEIGSLLKQGSRVKWALSGKEEMERLREDLERHKATLSVTLDLVSVIILKDIKDDTDNILQDTLVIKGNTAQIQIDINRVLQGIAQIQLQLNGPETAQRPSGYVLGRFLDELRTDAETILGDTEYLDVRTEGYPGPEHYQEEHDFKLLPEPTPAPITLRDTEGRRCLILFRACRTWLEMSKAIQQLYGHLSQKDDVRAGNYEAFGTSGEIILPAFWESFVLPDWEVALKLREVKIPNEPLKPEATAIDEIKTQSEGPPKEGQSKKHGSAKRVQRQNDCFAGWSKEVRKGGKEDKGVGKEKEHRKEKRRDPSLHPVKGPVVSRRKMVPPVSTRQPQSQLAKQTTPGATEFLENYPPLQPEVLQPVPGLISSQPVFRQLQITRHSLPTPTRTPAPIISPLYHFQPSASLSAFQSQNSPSTSNPLASTSDDSYPPPWVTHHQSPTRDCAISRTTKKSNVSDTEAKTKESSSRPRDKKNAAARNVKNNESRTRATENNAAPPSSS
ncbi:hypothetical protein QBC41DRAFT_367225 [Cercophora samala]|uniref:Ubiquitin-like domain-containing protein n=1 Tax=Cercophora samala TaxID=330535 RepID=A0AA39Z8V3_9PEZI|nr:hypothetical protein QBC41DRAFT_367225 [Cercophora samala]